MTMIEFWQFDSKLTDTRGWVEDAIGDLEEWRDGMQPEDHPQSLLAIWCLENAMREVARARALMQRDIEREARELDELADKADALL